MVLVGTIRASISRTTCLTDYQKYPQDMMVNNKKVFHEVVKRVYKQQKEDDSNIPEPPLIFIAMTDTCEEILQKVMSAPVDNEQGLQVKFRNKICTRCCAKICHVENESVVCTYCDDTVTDTCEESLEKMTSAWVRNNDGLEQGIEDNDGHELGIEDNDGHELGVEDNDGHELGVEDNDGHELGSKTMMAMSWGRRQ